MKDLEDRLDRLYNDIKNNLLYFYKKVFGDDDSYPINFLKWVKEITIKNKIIHMNKSLKDKEMSRRRRSHVYWIDFGRNIGSEFNDCHFCVVIYESKFTAIIVPLSSKKENESHWKEEENLILPIGYLEDLPDDDKRFNYALVHQMRAVSKQRLSNFKYKDRYLDLKLSDKQMDIIDNAISTYIVKKK